MGRVVLVTGVARDLGALFARTLAGNPEVDRVVGLDVVPPAGDLRGVKFVRADIRTPVVGKVIAVEDVDTVVHMNLGSSNRGSVKETNVIGTMQLLAACQAAPQVRKLVLQSSTAVYGTSPRDPAMFTESMSPRAGVRTGFPKDAVEVEGYTRGFARRRPDAVVTTLRLGTILSPHVRSAFGDYFSLPALPAVLGYDPRLQFLHPHDAIETLRLATLEDRPGTYNVVGDEVTTVSQAARRLGRPLVRLPSVGFTSLTYRLVRQMGSRFTPELSRLLTYGRVADTAALRDLFGYEPRYTTPQTLAEFADGVAPGLLAAVGGHRG
ncbi:MAG: NAD-dependent epimerase/dehydratase family protein [Nocardioidaceae bacterium]|nr:NAD-dependent epimerase/dehydratase family protein [Nocardioidaceae bacterium]